MWKNFSRGLRWSIGHSAGHESIAAHCATESTKSDTNSGSRHCIWKCASYAKGAKQIGCNILFTSCNV